MRTEETEGMMIEIAVMKAINHPRIMKCYEFYQTDEEFIMVMEIMPGGELFDMITEKVKRNQAKWTETLNS